MKSTLHVGLLVFVLGLLPSSPVASAQGVGASADLTGTVTDPSGAVVPGASVEVREISTGKTRSTKTNAAGQFTFSGLPAADYAVLLSSPGFKIALQDLTLRLRDRAVLSATLAIGSVTEAVEVTGASVTVVTRKAFNRTPLPLSPKPPATRVQLFAYPRHVP